MSNLCVMWSWYLVVSLVALFAASSRGVPASVGNRMIPDWWFTGVTAKTICYSGADCSPTECCLRPMLSANSYCMPLKRRAEVCDATPLMLYTDNEVHFGDCPCAEHLTCAGLQSRSVCVDLRNFEADLERLASQHLPEKLITGWQSHLPGFFSRF